MKQRNILLIGPLILLIFGGTTHVSAQSGGQFEMVRSSIDSGSQSSSGGTFEVIGTIGQYDASITPMTGADFELEGGFWPGNNDIIFKNNFE